MKLRNKKTGEITEANYWNIIQEYNSLAELNEEWEDYEEPKGMQEIHISFNDPTAVVIEFGTDEEAEKAVEKLKAWKRLKDKGFRFDIEEWEHSPLDEIFYGWNESLYNKEDRKIIQNDMRIVLED